MYIHRAVGTDFFDNAFKWKVRVCDRAEDTLAHVENQFLKTDTTTHLRSQGKLVRKEANHRLEFRLVPTEVIKPGHDVCLPRYSAKQRLPRGHQHHKHCSLIPFSKPFYPCCKVRF